MVCEFDNAVFHNYIKDLKKKHKNKNYNFGYNELLNYIMIHLKDTSKLCKILNKDKLNIKDLKDLNSKCYGIVNLELSGNGYIKNNELYFTINKKNTFLDLKDDIPNAAADINKNIIWHMHPWNISLDYKNNVPSFFSYEDLAIAFNYPGKKFIIFNMSCSKTILPCIYVVSARKNVNKRKAKKVVSTTYDIVFKEFISGNYNIDLEEIKRKFEEVDVYFDYIYRYDERSIKRILKMN
jgi:hypothetical protein